MNELYENGNEILANINKINQYVASIAKENMNQSNKFHY